MSEQFPGSSPGTPEGKQPSMEVVKWEPQPSPFVESPFKIDEKAGQDKPHASNQEPAPDEEEWEVVDAEIVDEHTDKTGGTASQGAHSHKSTQGPTFVVGGAGPSSAERPEADKKDGGSQKSGESKEGPKTSSSEHDIYQTLLLQQILATLQGGSRRPGTRPRPKVTSIRPPKVFHGPPPTTFQRVTRSSTASTWITPGAPEHHDHRGLVPEAPIDPTLDRDDIIVGESLPPITTHFLLGLRQWITEERMHRKQAKLEALARSGQGEVMQFVGRSILEGMNYRHPSLRQRPTTLLERTLARQADKVMNAGIERRGLANNVALTYMDGSAEEPDFSQPDIKLSRPEHHNNRKNERYYHKLHGQARRHDKAFKHLIGLPHRRAERLIRQRDELVRKREAIISARIRDLLL